MISFWYLIIGLIVSLFVSTDTTMNDKPMSEYCNTMVEVFAWPVFVFNILVNYFYKK